jgi:hypothetical protein
MKYFILLFVMLAHGYSCTAVACKNWIPESEAIKAINQEPNAGAITCKQLPNEKCFCFEGINWHYAKLSDVPIPSGEWSAPAAPPQDCQDYIDCSALISSGTFCDAYGESFVAMWGDLDNDGDLEAWCTEPIMTTTKVLEHDQAKKDVYDAEKAAKEQEKAEKESQKAQKQSACDAILDNWDTAADADKWQCVRYLLYKVHGK